MNILNLPLQESSVVSSQTPAYEVSRSSTSNDDDEEEDTLPYPAELPRSDFLNSNFDPQIYLSSLRNRHQTLEDLRSDLRARSQLLSRELLDLVNGNYEEFLSLGSDLNGGEEKVEGVRVGLLGFRRDVEGLRGIVAEREAEVGRLLEEKSRIRREVVLGRKMLEIDEAIENLEESLGIRVRGTADDDEDDDEEDADEDGEDDNAGVAAIATRKLGRQTEQYLLIDQQVARLGPDIPFLASLGPRLEDIRRTLLLDLSAGLRQARSARDTKVLLNLSRLFGDIGAESEALKVLKAS